MSGTFKKILNITTSVLVVLFVVFVALLLGARLFGVEPHIVLSGSMEPDIWTGSIVYVKPISQEEAQSLEVGEDVTYVVNAQGTKVTHRIYEVVGPAYVKNQHGEFVLDANGEKVLAKDQNGNNIIMYTTYGINNHGTIDGELGVGNLASTNVIGKPVFSIPLLGYVANFVQTPHGRIIAFGFCIVLIVMSLFGDLGSKEKGAKEKDKSEKSSEPNNSDVASQQTQEESCSSTPKQSESTNEG